MRKEINVYREERKKESMKERENCDKEKKNETEMERSRENCQGRRKITNEQNYSPVI
jgi:hypothetical protein